MSERMYPIPFERLMRWILAEKEKEGTVFGLHRFYKADPAKTLPIFGERIETPFGPAAGPNSQLAQNIIVSYLAGARFFEVKTVQRMDGEELAACVPRPCILTEDEGYNQEWSTELTVPQALEEYIKAWCAMKVLAAEFDLGDPDGFVINMSVGYDLAGIQSEKIDNYIETMKDATRSPVFAACKEVLKKLFPHRASLIDAISPQVSRSITLSTLHGCPPDEIERIASYLIREKRVHTFVKCNPTILGYRDARGILDSMGYDYVVFDEHHFNEDLQWADAIPMFERLQTLADETGVCFGLKLSNTFPVDTTRGELPNNEMYMSGRSLFPLTIEMCRRFSKQFDGRMKISFAGGAEFFNCRELFSAGIWPITVATTILKPGGYNRLAQLCEAVEKLPFEAFAGTDTEAIARLSERCRTDYHHVKPVKPLPSRKSKEPVPWFDCSSAPCEGGCPIRQDIPEYITLCGKGLYDEALKLITEKNPLPFITGTICAHRCMTKCSRSFYDKSVRIRKTKLLAAQKGYDNLMKSLANRGREPGCAGKTRPYDRPSGELAGDAFPRSGCVPAVEGKRVAIVGGGPTGMAAAYFLGRKGVPCTIFEREGSLGGIVRHVIPAFRISDEAIDKDAALIRAYGAEIRLNTPAPSVDELKKQGYTHVLFAVGAWKAGRLDLEGSVKPVIQWMKDRKAGLDREQLGNVVVIGGGNTAMDAARLAKREGASSVTLVYRRTKRYMPADPQELELAIKDGVEFLELAAPVRQENGVLRYEKMKLGAPDASGRRSPVGTGEFAELPCDLVVSAVGEKVDGELFAQNGVELSPRGLPAFETNIPGVYAAGDALRGPATVVEGIADAARFAEAVLGEKHVYEIPAAARQSREEAVQKKGILNVDAPCEKERCLACNTVCENCVDVCPNRANISVKLPSGSRQILHVDMMCNECGNCTAFCPYASEPCKDKLTLFNSIRDFEDSKNSGFVFLPGGKVRTRLFGNISEHPLNDLSELGSLVQEFILTVYTEYWYLFD